MAAHLFHHFLKRDTSDSFIWTKELSSPFQELIISWNGTRPKKEKVHLSFSLRYLDEWTPFFPYAEWAESMQKSLSFKANEHGIALDADTINLQKPCSAFRVQIQGAECIRLLHASVFSHEAKSTPQLDLGSQRIKLNLSPLSQKKVDHPRNGDLCSPTALASVVSYLLEKRDVDPRDFAEKVYDHDADIYGNWSLNIAEAASQLGENFLCYVARLNSFQEIIHNLALGIPSVVSVRGTLKGAPQPYHSGHLIAVCGIHPERGELYTMDPAFNECEETLHAYPLQDFLDAWHHRGSIAYLFKKVS